MDFLQALNWRYATKSFDATKKIPAETLELLLEALRLAPSSYGLQPWKFVVVENAELREKLKVVSWNQGQITDASALIVLCRKEPFGEADVEAYVQDTAKTRGEAVENLEGYKQMMLGSVKGRDEAAMAVWTSKQVYLALGVLLSAAAVNGIDTCPMEGFDAAQYDEILGLKEKGLRSVVLCPVGYRSETDKYATAKKVRFAQADLVIRA